MHLFGRENHFLGATLLIAGTSIGVGMLALPVVTAAGGFIPAVLLSVLVWLFMVSTSFLIVEACCWMPEGANFITISERLLGRQGALVCWLLYLFLFYCLMVAHVAAGGGALFELLRETLPQAASALLYSLIFIPVVYLGTHAVDRLNLGLMLGVILSYLLFVVIAMPHVHISLLAHQDWGTIWSSLPVMFIMIGFQNIIPTLYNYMKRDHRGLRKAIWIGSSIPLFLYLLWELMILGSVPLDCLTQALAKGQSGALAFQHTFNKTIVGAIAEFFALFATSTSFAGIAIAFFDFLADGFRWEKKGAKRLALLVLIFGVPLVFVCVNPESFITALQWGGGTGTILLFGFLPILDVWAGRYVHGCSLSYQFLRGGRVTLLLLLICSSLVLLSNLWQ
jgi:tyrosine-specific transport protein